MKTITFTGNRDIDITNTDLMWRLHNHLEDFINKGFTHFQNGLCYGADLTFCKSINKHKEKYPHIKLIGFIPHLNQSKLWSEENKKLYNKILETLDEIIQVTDSEYTAYAMHLRNDKMLDSCSQVLALWTGKKEGGTWSTIQKSLEKENIKEVFIIKS